jgi:CheY-like chemotaxis protein
MSLGLETLRVLLADDNPHMRSIVMTLLQSFGVSEIREAGDGGQALDVLRRWAPDLVIVDFRMAPMDGVEFTRRVRRGSDGADPCLPIIMMTGHSAKARVEEARDAGVTEFIVKPLTAKTLLNRLYAVIHRPRPFVRTEIYFGPDRRRRDDAGYSGPRRRAGEGAIRSPSASDARETLVI